MTTGWRVPEIAAVERRALEVVARGAASLGAVADALGPGAPARRVRVALYRLRDLGLLQLTGRARTAAWTATTPGRDAVTRG